MKACRSKMFSVVACVMMVATAFAAAESNDSGSGITPQLSVSTPGTGYEPWFRYMGQVVNSANGNLYLSFEDTSIRALGFDLKIVRAYNSQRSHIDGPFGFGWTHNYNHFLVENPNGSVTMVDGDGSSHEFEQVGSEYVSPAGIFSKLTKNLDGTFLLQLKNGERYNFDSGGTLTSIEDKNNNHLSFGYIGGKLATVADDSGLQLAINYNAGNRISGITDPLGRQISCQYDANGNLVEVTDAMGYSTLYLYDGLSGNLEAFVDPVGRVVTLSYITEGGVDKVEEIGNSLYDYISSSFPEPYVTYAFEYDSPNNIVKVTNRGYSSTIRVNSNGNPVSITKTVGGTAQLSWSNDMKILTLTDSNGNLQTFEYDSYGNLIQETDPLGYVTTYSWRTIDTVSQYISLLEGITNAMGDTTTFVYDANGNLMQKINVMGDSMNYFYDSHGNLIGLQDYRGSITDMSYDSHGYLTARSDPHGNIVAYEYDAVGRTVLTRDPMGETTYSFFDANDRATKIVDALGYEHTYTYGALGNRVQSTDANGHQTNYEYNYISQAQKITDALGNEMFLEYDGNGNPTQYTDGRGNNIGMNYNSVGSVTSIVDSLGNSESLTYDSMGNILSRTNKNGFATSYEYDALNRLARETNALGGQKLYEYDALDHLTKVTNENGYSTIYEYDKLNRLIYVSGPECGCDGQYLTYDANGNLVSQTDANGNTVTYAYDALNRLTTATDPLGNVVTYEYDSIGNVVRITDPSGHSTSYGFDGLDRLISTTDALGYVTTYEYDGYGNILSLTDPNGQRIQYQYNAMNDFIRAISPLGHVTEYEYDENRNLVKLTDANGYSTVYEYDTMNRLVRTSYPGGDSVEYEYDPNDNPVRFEDVGDPGDVITMEYDALDRLIAKVLDIDNLSKRIEYSYDGVGNRATMTDSEGDDTTFMYDYLNRLVSIIDPSGEHTTFEYDATSKRVRLNYPNGVVTTYTYGVNRLLDLTTSKSTGDVISSYSYAYDSKGNRLSMTDQDGDMTRYEYDALGRLTGVTYPSGSTTDYSYDAVGNRLVETVDGTSTYYSYDADNRLLTAGGTNFTYDYNGNLIQKVSGTLTTLYEYDFENRLTEITNPDASVVTFQYSADGERLVRTDDSGTVYYFHDIEDILSVLDASGSRTLRYTHGPRIDEPLIVGEGSARSNLHYDGLGSVALLTDSSENVIAAYEYDAFGKTQQVAGTLTNPHQYTGREYEEGSELYYYRTRFYSPEIGRFLSKDSLGNLYETNLYAYVENNPVNAIDPFGLRTWITLSDCVITVKSYIVIYGPGATWAFAKDIEKQINDFWNKNPGYGCCKVVFDVYVTNKSTEGDATGSFPGWDRVEIIGGVGASGQRLGTPNSGTGTTGTWRDNERNPGVYEHEYGHKIGLDDEYDYNGPGGSYRNTNPQPTDPQSVMAQTWGNFAVMQSHINTLMTNAGIVCPWWCTLYRLMQQVIDDLSSIYTLSDKIIPGTLMVNTMGGTEYLYSLPPPVADFEISDIDWVLTGEVQPGGTVIGKIGLMNTGGTNIEILEDVGIENDKGFRIQGLSVVDEIGQDGVLEPGEAATLYFAMTVTAGSPIGLMDINFLVTYGGATREVTITLPIILKMLGKDRSCYVHRQNALRTIRAWDNDIDEGLLHDLEPGDLVLVDGSLIEPDETVPLIIGWYENGCKLEDQPDVEHAHEVSADLTDEYGMGMQYWGFTPGQEEGNPGNGNGGLNGKDRKDTYGH